MLREQKSSLTQLRNGRVEDKANYSWAAKGTNTKCKRKEVNYISRFLYGRRKFLHSFKRAGVNNYKVSFDLARQHRMSRYTITQLLLNNHSTQQFSETFI